MVLYDPLVGRWLVSDFAWVNQSTGPFYQCIAVSQTSDPVSGGWYYYALQADTGNFAGYLNDYPKLGVWADGWYMTANMFQMTPPYTGFGVRLWALDRNAMINNQPLNPIYFDCTALECASLLPANLRGALPPPGSPAYFAAVAAPDSLELWRFHTDWTTPGNSTLTGPISLSVAEFAQAPFVPQLGQSRTLDTVSPRLMMQLQYRNLGGVESLWANHTVLSGGVAGVRWYEVRDPGGTPFVAQQSTYQPDSNHRWMGSLAVDQDGNMALGYSISSASMYPGIRYAGRLMGETPNQLPQAEATLVNGSGAQSNLPALGRLFGDERGPAGRLHVLVHPGILRHHRDQLADAHRRFQIPIVRGGQSHSDWDGAQQPEQPARALAPVTAVSAGQTMSALADERRVCIRCDCCRARIP